MDTLYDIPIIYDSGKSWHKYPTQIKPLKTPPKMKKIMKDAYFPF